MKYVSVLLLSVGVLCAGAADLVTKSGQTFANYKIKKVDDGMVTVVYLTPDGSPDSAEIPVADLPDAVAGALGAVDTLPAMQPVSLEKELTELGDALCTELSALDGNDKLARAALLSEVRSQARWLLTRYAETADFKFIGSDADGVLAAVVGTGKNSFLKCGNTVYIRGGLPPRTKQFRAKIYPGGLCGKYGTYSNVFFYGANENYALETMLEALANYAGNPLLFQPPAEEKPVVIENTTVNNITNVYVKERYPLWYSGWGGTAVVIGPYRTPYCPKEQCDKKTPSSSGKSAKGAPQSTVRPKLRPGMMAIPKERLLPQSLRSGNKK